MAGDKYCKRSTTRYVFTIGGTTVSWISKLQKVVALSTEEAEYVVSTEASKEMIWLQRFMEELGKKQENSRLYCDSESAIHLAKNSTFHSKTKMLSLKFCPQMVTGIQHLQTAMSPPMDQNYQKIISKRSKTIQLVIKSRCAMTTQGARAHVPSINAEKAHMRTMCDCGR
jgi:hypothetical protein